MRILFASDFHGHISAYRDLFALARRRAPDAVVLGGDLLPHPPRERPLEVQIDFARGPLRDLLTALHRDVPGLPVLAIAGNDDWAAAIETLAAPNLTLISGRAVALGDRFVAGCSFVPVTPFFMSDFDRFDDDGWTPGISPEAVLLTEGGALRTGTLDELAARPTVAAELDRLASLSPPDRTIYVVHTPPAQTALDRMRGDVHIGSGALRRFIERHQPPVTLHGHIHESHRLSGQIQDTIGKTVCVNVGPSLLGLRAVEVRIEEGRPPEVELVAAQGAW